MEITVGLEAFRFSLLVNRERGEFLFASECLSVYEAVAAVARRLVPTIDGRCRTKFSFEVV